MTRQIISYDIRCDRRRRRVVKALLRCAHRLQFSVFEGRLPANRWARLWAELMEIIDEGEDSLLMVPICGACEGRRRRGGVGGEVAVGDDIIV